MRFKPIHLSDHKSSVSRLVAWQRTKDLDLLNLGRNGAFNDPKPSYSLSECSSIRRLRWSDPVSCVPCQLAAGPTLSVASCPLWLNSENARKLDPTPFWDPILMQRLEQAGHRLRGRVQRSSLPGGGKVGPQLHLRPPVQFETDAEALRGATCHDREGERPVILRRSFLDL